MLRAGIVLFLACAAAACGSQSEPTQPRAPAPAPAASAPAAPAPQAGRLVENDWVITPAGLRGVRVGMTQDEALALLGSRWEAAGDLQDAQSCRILRFMTDAEGEYGALSYMVEGGRVTRYTVRAAETPSEDIQLESGERISTPAGIRIGSTEAEVRRAYPNAQVEGHRYAAAPARYFTVWTSGSVNADYVQDPAARGLRFVTDESGRVVEIHGGGPSIQYVEGCS